MGNRLSKIYTRTGDQGTTGLGDGSRVAKDTLRVEAMGQIDELNSIIGLLMCETTDAAQSVVLSDIQHDLFDLGGELSIPGSSVLQSGRIGQLEQQLDQLNDELPPLTEFILPWRQPASCAVSLRAGSLPSGRTHAGCAKRRRAVGGDAARVR